MFDCDVCCGRFVAAVKLAGRTTRCSAVFSSMCFMALMAVACLIYSKLGHFAYAALCGPPQFEHIGVARCGLSLYWLREQ